MNDKLIGVVDEPNPKYAEDLLGMKRHANALSSFILKANTPLTIGIQGEWGSGKTSLLNSIFSKLNDSGNCRQIWINAWEHSLLSTPEDTLLKITNEIIQEMISTDCDIKRGENVKKIAGMLFNGAMRVGTTATLGAKAGEVTHELLAHTSSIKILREQLSNIASEVQSRKTNPFDRFIIYIDDLDRIEPPVAVRILELLKNIFSVTNCVFVLAIDYQVVVRGLESKFGKRTEENQWEFRAFFDKIIQLPFMMPMNQYDIASYVGELLLKVGFEASSELDGNDLQAIIFSTIGRNPRSLKRLINSLALIGLFIKTDNGDEEDKFDALDRLMLFGMVCLQVSFPDLYGLLNAHPDFLNWTEDIAFEATGRREERDPQFSKLFEIARKTDDFDEIWEQVVFRVCYANSRQRSRAQDASRFFNLIRERFSNIKGSDITDRIAKILDYSSVTTVSTSDSQQNGKAAKDYSKYSFGGKELGKGALAREIVTKYVKDHPRISFSDLKVVFPDKIQGKAVFVSYEEALEILERTGYKRFAMKGDQVIQLSDCRVCVSNQWVVKNINSMIKSAKIIGMNLQ